MDLRKIGRFIQECRKSKKLTQIQLAQKIGVSEKTISKWECGNGFPDATLILPLCESLNINANELLSGKHLSDETYKKRAEENIINLTNQDVYKNKMLLTLECIIGYLSILVLTTFVMIASYVEIATLWRVLLIVFGFINCIIGVAFALKIEKDAGYYVCRHCKHQYIPTYKQVFWASHIGRTRHMKCPKCNKKSWHKKIVSKNNP